MERVDGGPVVAVADAGRVVGRCDGAVTALAAVAAGGRTLLIAGSADGELRVWRLAARDGDDLLARQRGAHDGGVRAVGIGRLAGRLVAVSGGADGTVRVWEPPGQDPDAEPGGGLRQALAPLRARSGTVTAVVAAERDGRAIAAAGGDGGLLDLWQLDPDRSTGFAANQLLGGNKQGPTLALAAAVLPNRLVVVAGNGNGTVAKWELSGLGVPFVDIRGRVEHAADAPVTAVAVVAEPGSALVATGAGRDVRLWSLSTLRPVGEPLRGHGGPVGALASGMVGDGTVLVSGGGDGTVRAWSLPLGVPAIAPLRGHDGAVNAVALVEVAGEPTIVSGGADGTVRAWRLHLQPAEAPAAGRVAAAPGGPLTDQVDWVPDAPATRDLLRRAPLASVLATRMRRLRAEEPTASFLTNIDGPWGSGKSTLLNLLHRELGGDWLVVWFDAWRQSRIGPPWWALLTALRRALRGGIGPLRRPALRLVEGLARARRTGAPYLLALGLLAAAAVGIAAGVRVAGPLPLPAELDATLLGSLAQAVPAVVVAGAALWAGTRVLGRFLLWDSASGARLFMESGTNPMGEVAEHFRWLLRKARRPVAFFIDDLDRCRPEYVVELLDTLQTTLHGDGHAGEAPAGVHFVIAADSAWIRQSYEAAYGRFAGQVAEPGGQLGHLFVDKLFQLTVPVPVIGARAKEDYLRELLGTGPRARARPPGAPGDTLGDGGAGAAEVERVRSELARSRSEAEVVRALQAASPEARELVAGEAVKKLALPAVQAGTEHALQRFAPLLSANPRGMKRFVNAYGILRTVRTLEGIAVASDTLALWIILQIRWPRVANHLATDPEAVRYAGAPIDRLDPIPEPLRPLFAAPELGRLVRFRPGGPLTPDLIRACCGDAATRAP